MLFVEMPLYNFVNLIHLIFVFSPLVLLFLKKSQFGSWFKYYVLIVILTPLHWHLNDNKCLITNLSKLLGDTRNNNSDSSFSETWLKWLYKPLLELFGLKWESKEITKMIYIHWIFNFIIIWNIIFFVLK